MADFEFAPSTNASPPRAPYPTLPPDGPGIGDVGIAAFRQGNSVVSALQAVRSMGAFEPVDGYSPWDEIKDKPQYLERASDFAGFRSPAETKNLMDRIDTENADRHTLAASGVTGIIASTIAGALDPTMLLPGRVAIGVFKDGTPLVRGALEVGGAMAAQSTTQEAVLQASQADRPLSESIVNVGSATILGALLGGAAAWLSPAEHAAAVAGLDRDRARMDAHVTGQDLPRERAPPVAPGAERAEEPAGPVVDVPVHTSPPMAADAGAAATDIRTISTLAIAPTGTGLERIGFDKGLQSMNSPFLTTRKAHVNLAELPLMTVGNKPVPHLDVEGQPILNEKGLPIYKSEVTSTEGAPLESIARTQKNTAQAAVRDLLADMWKEVRFGDQVPRGAMIRDAFGRFGGLGASDKPTFEQFKTMVSEAIQNGNQHDLPQVQKAAEYVSKEVFEKWAVRAEGSLEGFKRAQQVIGEGYFPHLWNKVRIAARRSEFGNQLTQWYASDQAAKRGAQDRLRAHQGALESHEATIKKLTGRLERKQGDLEEDEALRDEVSRLNKFAFQRATALRESGAPTVVGARGGAPFETKVRERGNTLADRASAHAHEVEEIEEKLQAAHASAAEVRGRIEEEIGKWEGKSAVEAKSALKAREKYEAERDAARAAKGEGKLGRTASADDAVDKAVKRILASDRDVSMEDLRAKAEQTIDHILGSPDGRLAYDESPVSAPQSGVPDSLRGSLAKRALNVPNSFAKDWIENDIEKVVHQHLRTFIPDVLLAERFGDVEMSNVFRELNEESSRMVAALPPNSQKAAKDLEKARQRDITNIAATRDTFRGLYGVASDGLSRNLGRISAVVRNASVILNMGMGLVSSIGDSAGPVFRHGMMNTFGDAWWPYYKSLATNQEYSKEVVRQVKSMGITNDVLNSSRSHMLGGTPDGYEPHSPFERTLQQGADKMQLVNGLAYWTDHVKMMAASVAMHEIYRAAKAEVAGTATKKQIANLRESNIQPHVASRIAELWDESGNRVDGIMLPNTADWKGAGADHAREIFEAALGREVNISVVTPGIDKPKWTSDPVLAMLGQFKGYSIAATTRIMIANLQRADAQTLQGLVASVGMGMMSYKIAAILGGQPTSDRPQDWIKEGMSRGNVFGILEEGNTIAAKLTRGKVDVYRAIGADKPLAKSADASAAEQLLGPAYKKLKAINRVTGAAATGDWNAGDVHALRTVIGPGQNLPGFRSLLDQVEAGANNAFGIPQKKQ